jgi:multidrug transporter EmrE-like cation transporter
MDSSGGSLSTAVNPIQVVTSEAAKKRQAVLMVILCTVLGAVGQVLIKFGANALHQHGTIATLLAMAANVPLIAGYVLYGIMTVLFVFALKDGELSVLFPIISLTYVWVAGLSAWIFQDSLNWPKIAGIFTIVAGVGVLGTEGRK